MCDKHPAGGRLLGFRRRAYVLGGILRCICSTPNGGERVSQTPWGGGPHTPSYVRTGRLPVDMGRILSTLSDLLKFNLVADMK